MDDIKPIEHYRAKHNGMIPARFVKRDGKWYHIDTGLPVRTYGDWANENECAKNPLTNREMPNAK